MIFPIALFTLLAHGFANQDIPAPTANIHECKPGVYAVELNTFIGKSADFCGQVCPNGGACTNYTNAVKEYWSIATFAQDQDIFNRITWAVEDPDSLPKMNFTTCYAHFYPNELYWNNRGPYKANLWADNLCKVNNVMQTSFVKKWYFDKFTAEISGRMQKRTLYEVEDFTLEEYAERKGYWGAMPKPPSY